MRSMRFICLRFFVEFSFVPFEIDLMPIHINVCHQSHQFLGNVPGRPQGGRHGMVFGQIPASSTSVPLVPGSTSFSQCFS